MTRLTKTSLFALLGLTVTFAGSTDAFACGRRGGGGGYGGGYGSSFSYPPSYSHAPNYAQPVYRQPVVQQPVTPLVRQQPVTQQPLVQRQPVQQPAQQQFVQQQPVQQQPVQQQPVQQQPVQQQAIGQQPVAQQPVAQQPVAQQPAAQQPAVSQQPVQTAQAPVQTPQAQAPAQTPVQTPQPTAPASDIEKSALELLSQFGAVETTQPEATVQAQSQGFDGVGNWAATLSNGATISLEMRSDGSFTWTAMKNGKPSTFSGTFALDGESLTLIRSDRQQLNGTLIAPGTNGFTFKLDGVKDNGLQFARS